MRKALCAWVLVGVIGLVVFGGQLLWEGTQTFLGVGPSPYQRFTSDNDGALLTNDTGASVTGLRVTFSSAVSPVTGEGIGATVTVESNADGVVMLVGDIPVCGTVSVEWPVDSAEIVSAEWLQGDAVVGAVDIHVPMAVMSGRSEIAVTLDDTSLLSVQTRLGGGLSRSPDESPIVRYLWEWSDGTSQEGQNVTRTLLIDLGPFWEEQVTASVTLTVWNAVGESSSVSHTVFAVSPLT